MSGEPPVVLAELPDGATLRLTVTVGDGGGYWKVDLAPVAFTGATVRLSAGRWEPWNGGQRGVPPGLTIIAAGPAETAVVTEGPAR